MTLIVSRPKAVPQSAIFLSFTMTLGILADQVARVKMRIESARWDGKAAIATVPHIPMPQSRYAQEPNFLQFGPTLQILVYPVALVKIRQAAGRRGPRRGSPA